MPSYFRPEIDALDGYTPGEQPKINNLIKLNTNENPYPPSPAALRAAHEFDAELLHRYPDPNADMLRDAIAQVNSVRRENVIAGNGSDDILTMTFRAFTAPDKPLACLDPSYSLYPVLAAMQGAPVIRITLDAAADFAMPDDAVKRAGNANIFIITRPNAPTGNTFDREYMRTICREFKGIVMFDEAYADFADDNCMEFASEFDNVIVSRTFSKSYALAGLRLGYAVASPKIIEGLFKLKDSYNLDRFTQAVGRAAFLDRAYLARRCAELRTIRDELRGRLLAIGFRVIPSSTNFLFAAPPDGDGEAYFRYLRDNAVLVRYFKGPVTGSFVRITVGTPAEAERLLELSHDRYAK
ncbi:MAG: histidinol-phosphate transaminase [Victivallaceae bacterium]|nr:histidinol-phosphate transaminase [Victivallaceae bacterium]